MLAMVKQASTKFGSVRLFKLSITFQIFIRILLWEHEAHFCSRF